MAATRRTVQVCFFSFSVLTSLLLSSSIGASGVGWYEWTPQAFIQARSQGKLIFVDIGTEWCGACRLHRWIDFSTPEAVAGGAQKTLWLHLSS